MSPATRLTSSIHGSGPNRERFEKAALPPFSDASSTPGVCRRVHAYAAKHYFSEMETPRHRELNAGNHGKAFSQQTQPRNQHYARLRRTERPTAGRQVGDKSPSKSMPRLTYPKSAARLLPALPRGAGIAWCRTFPTIRRARFLDDFGQEYLTPACDRTSAWPHRRNRLQRPGKSCLCSSSRLLLPNPQDLGGELHRRDLDRMPHLRERGKTASPPHITSTTTARTRKHTRRPECRP